MADLWTDRWNERYSKEEFAYGEQPNIYFKTQLDKLNAGAILLPTEGEGRNAVYAARQGWRVSAFDISGEGQNKAMKLAAAHNVTIDYRVGTLEEQQYTPEQFDVIALIYAHFPAGIKSSVHKALDKYLRKGGIIIFEAFSKAHMDYMANDPGMGGPKDEASLFSTDEIKADFANYDILELAETEVALEEGAFHNGLGSVIRFVGRKK